MYHQSKMVEVVKPAVDKLQYRCVVLDNGIRITLVSDPDADKAAAAMDVRKRLSPTKITTCMFVVEYPLSTFL